MEKKDSYTISNINFFCLGSYSQPHLFGIKAGWFVTKSQFYRMKVSGNGIVFLGNLKILNMIMNDFILIYVYLRMI